MDAFFKTLADWVFAQHTVVVILIGVNYIQYRERQQLLKVALKSVSTLALVDRSLQHVLQILQIRGLTAPPALLQPPAEDGE